MFINVLLCCLAASPIFAGIALLIAYWFDIPDRTADDLVDYLLPVDLDKLESLLDPSVEYYYRLYLSPKEFRRLQLKRIHQFLELVNRMSRNAAVLVDFANKESDSGNPFLRETAQNLRDHGVSVRIYVMGAKTALRFWLLFRLRAPEFVGRSFTLTRMRKCLGVPVPETYRQLKDAAINLYGFRRPNVLEQISEVL